VLPRVQAPSLIIVSGNDEDDIRSNDMAFRRLSCPKQLVRLAVDRFTTTGVTDKAISRLAFVWFIRTMVPASTASSSDHRSDLGVNDAPWSRDHNSHAPEYAFSARGQERGHR
jgi:hypothetical protein